MDYVGLNVYDLDPSAFATYGSISGSGSDSAVFGNDPYVILADGRYAVIDRKGNIIAVVDTLDEVFQ